MATPYSEIYKRAIFRFKDYGFLKLDNETKEDILEMYLTSSRAEMQRVANVDLSDYDNELKQFNTDLDEECMEILAVGITYHWLSMQTLNSQSLKNVLNSRDYYFYSPANLLKEVQTLRSTLRAEYLSRMRAYSYRNSKIGDLKN